MGFLGVAQIPESLKAMCAGRWTPRGDMDMSNSWKSSGRRRWILSCHQNQSSEVKPRATGNVPRAHPQAIRVCCERAGSKSEGSSSGEGEKEETGCDLSMLPLLDIIEYEVLS